MSDNVVKRTDDNIKAVCQVMCECDFLDEHDIAHYCQIAGFKPDVDKHGNKYFKFKKKYTKADYLHAIAKVLYNEPPKEIERDAVVADLDFFLNSFGEVTHTVHRSSRDYQSALSQILQLTKNSVGGLKGTEEST